MIDLTEHLRPHAVEMNDYFERGARAGWTRYGDDTGELAAARWLYAQHRPAYGFEQKHAPLLTAPAHNKKLAKGETPAYGLTLQHTTTRVRKRLVVNACPHAGDCMKVCVLNNGHGNRPSVIRGRQSKTTFLATQPRAFSYLLGFELTRALGRHLAIRWRPNVNSDIRWEELIPSAFDGSALGGHATAYDYTKDADRVLVTDGWVAPTYRLAYSWNENSSAYDTARFLAAGGSVAMVTARKKGERVMDKPLMGSLYWPFPVVDADLTDEWMFEPGVVGDLSAKGRARNLIGKSGFVVQTGEAA